MSSTGPSSPPPDPNQPTYVWSRIDPRRNRLVSDKLQMATRGIRKEIHKETQRTLLENQLNCNTTGVDEKILHMWASKIQSHAELCYETIFCYHWNLLGHERTGAFVRASSAILGRHIEQLANTEAHKAQMTHHRRGGIGKSLAGLYRNSGGSVRKQLEEKWDIEARELDLAASIARAQRNTDRAPRPERSGMLWDSARDSAAQMKHTNSGCATLPRNEEAPETGDAGNLTDEDVGKKRAADVVRARREIAEVRDQMDGDDDYDRLKAKYPTFMLFKICDRDPELKLLLLGIKGHHQRRALRFAKQVAASHNGIKLNTIEKAWDKYNPDKKTRQHGRAPHSIESVTGSPRKSL